MIARDMIDLMEGDSTDEEDDNDYIGDSFESMYISEKRLAGIPYNKQEAIAPGTRTICHAMATISTSCQGNANDHQLQVKVKLDSCGSVSIAHSDHLMKLKKAKDYAATRSMARRKKDIKKRPSNTSPEGSHEQQSSKEDVAPVISEGRIKWKRVPREPIPQLSDINLWVGQQLRHVNMPAKYLNMQPEANLIPVDSTFPEGLLAVPNAEGQPRIIVPTTEVKALILQTHEDIHHQNYLKVLHVLKATYYWPNMAKDIERWCTSCNTCATATVRRKHLKTKFDLTSLHLKPQWAQGNIMVLTSTD
jgi:hypothetical protein